MNKVHSIYISVPWFRFTLKDLALRVLFHQFQIIFDRIRLTFSVSTRINKLLVNPNERLNNIILEGLLKIMAVFRATKLGELVLSLVARLLPKANRLTCSFVFAPTVIHTSLLKASITVKSNGFNRKFFKSKEKD